jgi:hypothetical protein
MVIRRNDLEIMKLLIAGGVKRNVESREPYELVRHVKKHRNQEAISLLTTRFCDK